MALFFVIFILVLAGGGAGLYFFVSSLTKRDEIWRSLNLRLLLVRLPKDYKKEDMTFEQLRERISVMESVYSNLLSVHDTWWNSFIYGKPSFALEITTPHIGEEISFYCAVPKKFVSTVEKIIHANFPAATVDTVKDYNIFNPVGSAAATEVVLTRDFIFPIKTYRDIPSDPLRAITNVFSKLSREGEGASFQIVARPAPGFLKKEIHHFTHKVLEGKANIRSGPQFGAVEILASVWETIQPPTDKQKEEARSHRMSPQDDELLKRIDAKSAKNLFEANIRLVVSASTQERADAFLKDLESALSQFTDPLSNQFKLVRVDQRNLKKSIYRFSFRVFNESKKIVLNSEELTSLFHFPNTLLETPKVDFLKAREAAAPPNLPEVGIQLGANVYRGVTSPIRIQKEDRRRHVYVIGQTGTGKSVLLKNMIRQDIENGEGVCFIDPHGDTVEEILNYVPRYRMEDVVYFNPADTALPLGLNMLEYDVRFPEQKTMVVNELFSIFQKLYGAVPESMGPMFEQYFRNSTLLVMDDPSSGNTLLEIERVLADRDFRELKLSRTTNVVVRQFWEQIAEKAGGEASLANIVPYITSKFDTFLANEIMRPIIAQEKSAFNFRDIMDQKKILLINLSKGRLGELNSSLLGLILVGKLLIASLSRTDIPEATRNDFYLYIDEFQNVTTPSIATILSEARKYRLDLIISHQFTGQLEDNIKKAVFGNVGSLISFRIGSEDGEFLEKQFQPIFNAHDLINIDNYNCYVKLLINGQTSEPFNMKTVYQPKPENPLVQKIKELSRTKYGRAREEIEAEILRKHM